jgi:hypothetical protein
MSLADTGVLHSSGVAVKSLIVVKIKQFRIFCIIANGRDNFKFIKFLPDPCSFMYAVILSILVRRTDPFSTEHKNNKRT